MKQVMSLVISFVLLSWCPGLLDSVRAEEVSLKWVSSYDGPDGGDDTAVAAVVDGLGQLCVAGTSFGGTARRDILVIKYGPEGNESWSARYDSGGDDIAGALAADLSGNIHVSGISRNEGEADELVLVTYRASGSEAWTSSYPGPIGVEMSPGALALDRWGNAYVTWQAGDGDAEAVVLKFDAAGTLCWCSTFAGPGSDAAALALNGDGTLFAAGTSRDGDARGDYLIVKYDADGERLWSAAYQGPAGEDRALALCTDTSGRAFVSGCSEAGHGWELATAAFDENGDMSWVSRAGGNWDGVHASARIGLDHNGCVVTTGCGSDGNGGREHVTLRYDEAGTELWSYRTLLPAAGEAPVSLAVGGDGAVYLAGLGDPERGDATFALVKLDPTGVEQWSANHIALGPGAASALVVDRAGRVFATGWAGPADGDLGIATLRYDQESGTRLVLAADDPCAGPGDQITVTVAMANVAEPVSGGQFFLQYDPSRLQFTDAATGCPEFGLEIYEQVDQTAGTIDYAVGLPFGGTPVAGDRGLAVFTFAVIDSPDGFGPPVSFRQHVPPSRLSTAEGDAVHPVLLGAEEAEVEAPVFTWLPGDLSVPADAGFCSSAVAWPDPEAESGGEVDVLVSCEPSSGTVFPAGSTTVTCTATGACGRTTVATFDVVVEPFNEMLVDLKLFGQMAPGPFQRSLVFELSGPDAVTVEQEASFVSGMTSAVVPVPCGDYRCVAVRDPLHSLQRALLPLAVDGTSYRANFRSAGKVLIPGNLNDDHWVDILDFGVLMWQWGRDYGSGDSAGTADWPNADVNGDGKVNQWDFKLFRRAALRGSESGCGDAPESVPPPLVSVTLEQLQYAGMAELSAGDLNGDGVVDRNDVVAFIRGSRP